MKINKSPLVSIIVPNYNYARFLEARITSILNQTYTNFELILLDDASTDDSVAVLNEYKNHPKVTQLVVNEKNTGSPFQQWMKGAVLAKGEWIWIAEADDLCEPTFLEECMHYIGNNEHVAVCNVGSVCIDVDGNNVEKEVNYWLKKESEVNAIIFDGKKYIEHVLYWKNCIPNASGVIFSKACVLNLANKEWLDYRYCGDWLFWVEMAMQGDVIQVYKYLNYFRQHNSQTIKWKINGEALSETFKISLYIEKLFPCINAHKRKQKHGRDARSMRHVKTKLVKENLGKEYRSVFHSSNVSDYLYFKICRHLRFLPFVLTEEKDREIAVNYSRVLH